MFRILKRIARKIGFYDKVEVVKIAKYQVSDAETLRGRTILITGGSSGIGLAIAKKCLERGGRVLITGRNEAKLRKVLMDDPTGMLMTMPWDVSNLDRLSDLVEEAFAKCGGTIDILVNNAGMSIREQYGQLTLDVWEKLIRTNLTAPVFIAQSVANKWIGAKAAGVVLNVSSMAGIVPAFDAYGASKCALSSMTKGMARTLAPHRIRVNAIAPGVVIGTELRDLQRSIKPDGNIKCDWIPARRYAVPDEIAELASFMISDRSSYMNGAVVVCDGAGSVR